MHSKATRTRSRHDSTAGFTSMIPGSNALSRPCPDATATKAASAGLDLPGVRASARLKSGERFSCSRRAASVTSSALPERLLWSFHEILSMIPSTLSVMSSFGLRLRKVKRAHVTALIAGVIGGSTGSHIRRRPCARLPLQRLALPPDQLRAEGNRYHKYLEIVGDKIGRSTLFGIPLQQMWSYANSGDFAPTYYLQTDAPLTTTPLPTR
jgi:hypothetical protein